VASEIKLKQFFQLGLQLGCPRDQLLNFSNVGLILQERQLAASAAARLCDQPEGPTAIGYGGARGGGKSHWLLAQMGADDCQRVPGLSCLLLRKVSKANTENFENLRQRVFPALKHTYNASRGILTFENGSRIVIRHYQHEKEIDAFLGIEYDVIGIEEATTLIQRKYHDIRTCLRTSKPGWRPRLYATTNPGGVGHDWFHKTFVLPYEHGSESATRFIPARVEDNKFINPEYKAILDECTGWQREAWRNGNWNIASGQFFNTFRHDVHVIRDFDQNRITEWFAGMDYGFTHYTVFLLAGRDADDNLFIVDEHAERNWIPARHALAIKEMCQRHHLFVGALGSPASNYFKPNAACSLGQISAGGDLFSAQFDGSTIAKHFAGLGLRIKPANANRVQGWAEIQHRLGDPDNGIKPTLFIHERCRHLLNCLPFLQHDPDHPADVLKTNVNEEGLGGDDAADALRYLVATRILRCAVVKLRGF
jgi:phage terminase large subunit